MKNGALACILTVLCCLGLSTQTPVQYAGVSLSGAEFGSNVPGTFNSDYTYPTNAEVDYFVSKGMNTMRIPFLWERLQRQQLAAFDQTELGRLTSIVNYITTTKGKYALLDPHNYARYYGQVIGQGVPVTAFTDFWTKLANVFKGNNKVLFGIMNEPHDMDSTLWASNAQSAITAIRATGATNLITVPGNGYTGAWSWTPTAAWYGTANSIALASITDPLNNYIFEVHQYLDSDSSGTQAGCVSNTIGSQRLQAFTNWARQNGKRAILGEIGAGSDATCLSAIDNMFSYMESNSDVWVGWTWWSAGPWWGNYFTSIEPANGQDKPQMSALLQHLPATGPNGGGTPGTTGRVAATTGHVAATTGRVVTTGVATTGKVAGTTTGRVTPVSTTGAVITPPNPCGTGGGIPTSPDSITISKAPFVIANSGSFSVVVAYSSTGSRVIVVDVMSSTGSATWYGKGTLTVQAGTGTVSVAVQLASTPPAGPNYSLHAWMVDAQLFNSKPDPWNYALSTVNTAVSVGSGTIYAQDAAPCSDNQQCITVCGSADNIASCNCDDNGQVSVVCAGSNVVTAETSSSQTVAPSFVVLTIATTLIGWFLL